MRADLNRVLYAFLYTPLGAMSVFAMLFLLAGRASRFDARWVVVTLVGLIQVGIAVYAAGLVKPVRVGRTSAARC